MFRTIRGLSRPVGVLLLAILVSSSPVAECTPLGDAPATDMPCCHEMSGEAAFDAECCAVRQPESGPGRQPLAVPQTRPADGRELLPAAPAGAEALPSAPVAIADPYAGIPPVPQDRLYLRNSAIRR